MIHPKQIDRFNGSLTELAEDLGNLQYDVLAEVLGLLAAKIEQDVTKDSERGRVKLAASLKQCADNLNNAEDAIIQAWAICQPYIIGDKLSLSGSCQGDLRRGWKKNWLEPRCCSGKGAKINLRFGFRCCLTIPKSWFSGAAKYLTESVAFPF